MSYLLLALFLFFASLLALRKASAIVLLPCMAISFHLLAHFAFFYSLSPEASTKLPEEAQALTASLPSTYHHLKEALFRALYLTSLEILSDGPGRLFSTIIAVLFGGILAKMLEKSGIAHNIVRFTAEIAGENPLVHALVLSLVSALLFTVLGGLGAVILVGTIVFPVWLSVGLSPIVSACAFLLALSLGGALNPINWKLYIDVLKIPQGEVQHFALLFLLPFLFLTTVFIVLQHKKEGVYRYFSSPPSTPQLHFPFYAYLAPFLPLFILLASGLLQLFKKIANPYPINGALFVGIVCTFFSLRPEKGRIQFLLQCAFESLSAVGPAILLIMGIGMLISSVFSFPVRYFLQPLIEKVIPGSPLTFVLAFSLLAPLALYRGPLNIWGLGFGLAGLLQTAGMKGEVIMGLLYSVGMIQGVCDPTNTHNVWVANQLGVEVNEIMKRTLPYMWLLAIIGLIVTALRFF